MQYNIVLLLQSPTSSIMPASNLLRKRSMDLTACMELELNLKGKNMMENPTDVTVIWTAVVT